MRKILLWLALLAAPVSFADVTGNATYNTLPWCASAPAPTDGQVPVYSAASLCYQPGNQGGGGVTGLANPTGTIGLTVVNGSASTAMRSDGAPALSQAIVPIWTGLHTFTVGIEGSTSTGILMLQGITGTGASILEVSPDTQGGGLNINVKGATATTTGAGGTSLLDGGAGCCSGDGGAGGVAGILGGAGSGTGNGGGANSTGGAGGATGAGGNSFITGGQGGSTSGLGGQAGAVGGAAGAGSASNGGAASLTGGAAGSGAGSGVGGAINITSGAGGATSGNSGAINIKGGAVTSGTIGAVGIQVSTNGATNINTGTSSGIVTIGNSSNTGKTALAGLAANTGAQTGYVCYSSTGNVLTYDGTNTCLVSARRFKKDIEPLSPSLDKVMQLKPVSFKYKKPWPGDKNMAKEQIGLIAEDVEQVEPRLVTYDKDGKIHGIKDEQLPALLIKALQEQQKEIEELKKRLK